MKTRFTPGIKVVRKSPLRRWNDGGRWPTSDVRLVRGTVRSLDRDDFGNPCCVVEWDRTGLVLLMDNRDLRRA